MTSPLVLAWEALYAGPRDAKTTARFALNNAIGGAYSAGRVNDWRNRRRPIPAHVRAYMLAQLMPSIIERIRAARKRDLPAMEAEILAIISETLT